MSEFEPGAVVFKTIRVRTEESAHIYTIFEAHEGIVSYTTLPAPAGTAYRDIQLMIPVGFLTEVEDLLRLTEQEGGIADLVYPIG